MAPRSASAAKVVSESDRPKRQNKKAAVRKVASAEVPKSSGRVAHEVLAVLLCCGGLLTLLALVSYDPADASLNSASADARVRNWIGPAGAYWSDALLQLLGIGAYALSLGALLAGWRALVGRRVLPGFREAFGTVLLIACSGTLAELWIRGESSYPAGGVGGAIFADILLENFATLGAVILSGASVLIALAVTADGILRGLGLRGLSVARDGLSRLRAGWTLFVEKRKHLRTLRANRKVEVATPVAEPAPVLALPGWGWSEDQEQARAAERRERVEQAKSKAESLARKKAEAEERRAQSEAEAAKNKPRKKLQVTPPDVVLDQTVDLPAEEHFELGKLSGFDEPEPDTFEPVDESEDGPPEVEIRAADFGYDRPGVSPVPSPSAPPAVPNPAPAATEPPKPPPSAEASSKPARSAPVTRSAAPAPDTASEPEIVDVRPEVD
ncbi:MAG: DNA translocase FtsK 4TM domain-containing protein, partial [Myxococcota bacterium]